MTINDEYNKLKQSLKTSGNPEDLKKTCFRLLNNFSDKFYDWWDPKICSKHLSFLNLLKNAHEYFDIWFPYLDKNNLINWKLDDYYTFFQYFNNLKKRQKLDVVNSILKQSINQVYSLYFLVWKFVGPENIPDDWKLRKSWYTSSLLVCYPVINKKDFEKIWNPNLFIWSRTTSLLYFYSDYLDIWWNINLVRKNVSVLRDLIYYCGEKFVDIWFPEFLEHSKPVIEDYILKETNCYTFSRFLRATRKYFDQYRYVFKKRKYYSYPILQSILTECQEVLVDIWDSVKHINVSLNIITKIDPKILNQIKTLELLKNDGEEG